jgi:hypothetical protein
MARGGQTEADAGRMPGVNQTGLNAKLAKVGNRIQKKMSPIKSSFKKGALPKRGGRGVTPGLGNAKRYAGAFGNASSTKARI